MDLGNPILDESPFKFYLSEGTSTPYFRMREQQISGHNKTQTFTTGVGNRVPGW